MPRRDLPELLALRRSAANGTVDCTGCIGYVGILLNLMSAGYFKPTVTDISTFVVLVASLANSGGGGGNNNGNNNNNGNGNNNNGNSSSNTPPLPTPGYNPCGPIGGYQFMNSSGPYYPPYQGPAMGPSAGPSMNGSHWWNGTWVPDSANGSHWWNGTWVPDSANGSYWWNGTWVPDGMNGSHWVNGTWVPTGSWTPTPTPMAGPLPRALLAPGCARSLSSPELGHHVSQAHLTEHYLVKRHSLHSPGRWCDSPSICLPCRKESEPGCKGGELATWLQHQARHGLRSCFPCHASGSSHSMSPVARYTDPFLARHN